uniref:Major facilitator superfamily (MFS) profile domain-containing protein n=1 Tax=Anopheles atroparvus TaxID=41427 RepID=A0AAG5DWD6_ANOAO
MMAAIKSWFSLKQSEKDRLTDLESDEEYRERWITIRLVYLSGFLMFLSFGVVTTGLWPYLEEMDPTAGKAFLSVIFAAPPAGQLLFSPLIGWYSNKVSSVRISFVLLTVLFVFANGLYSMIELFSMPYRKYVMLLSRFTFGIATSINTLSRAYISTATKLCERTQAISMSALGQTLGLALGPIIQASVSAVGNVGFQVCGVRFNMYTLGGWICAVAGIVYIVLLNPSYFKHRTIAAKEALRKSGTTIEKDTWKSLKLSSIWLIMMAYGILMFFYVTFQTAISPISLDQFAWSHEDSLFYLGILLTSGTACSCVVFLLLPQLCKRFNEQNVFVYFAMLPLFLSQVLMIPVGTNKILIANSQNGSDVEPTLGCPDSQKWCNTVPSINHYQLTISYAMLCISFSVGIAISQTILSKLLGTRPQGNWMALYTSIGGIMRIMGPGAVMIYVRHGTYWLFGLGSAVSGVVFIWTWLHKEHLQTARKSSIGAEMQLMTIHSK